VTSTSLAARVASITRSGKSGQTTAYYIAFVALGLTTASLGPTLEGLANQTGSALDQVSFLFTARALGYLLGSFVGGRLYDRWPGNRTMAAALGVIVALLALLPAIPLLWLMTVVLLLVGAMEGVVDVGGNTLIVWVHRDKVGPFMNGLHLFYGLGAFLAPLVVAQAITFGGAFSWGYWALALLVLPVILRLLPLPSPPSIVSHHDAGPLRVNPLLLALVVLFLALVAGGENAFGGWIKTYASRSGLADDTTAYYVNAAFWGSFTLARLASIPIAARVRARWIVLADLVISSLALAVLLAFSASPEALWLGTILFGIGAASAFPTMLTFAGRHMTITGKVTGWFFVGASAGGMLVPWLIGQFFEPVGPWTAMAVILVSFTLSLGVFGLILARIAAPSKG
jgi:fucose permease